MYDITFIDIPNKTVAVPDIYRHHYYRWRNAYEHIFEKVTKKEIVEKKYFYTPGLLCLGAYLRQNGYKPKYIHNVKDKQEIERTISQTRFVGFSTTTVCLDDILDMAKYVKEYNPKVHIIFGGYHTHYYAEETLREHEFVDYVIVGEGEKTLLQLVGGDDTENIKGLFFRKGKEIVFNGYNSQLSPEEIPTPDYELFSGDLTDYNYNVSTMRGCTGTCFYCVNNGYWGKPRLRPIENVIRELKYLNSVLGDGYYIHLTDNLFTYDKDRIIELCNKINTAGINLYFSCDTSADLIDGDIVKALESANVIRVCLGFEDADNNILKISNKKVSYEDNLNASRIIMENSQRMLISAYWLLGLPGSTHDSMHYNIQEIRRLIKDEIVHIVAPKIFIPYPGTPFFSNPDKFNIKIHSTVWSDYERHVFPPIFSAGELSNNEIYSYLILYYTTIVQEFATKWGLSEAFLLGETAMKGKYYV